MILWPLLDLYNNGDTCFLFIGNFWLTDFRLNKAVIMVEGGHFVYIEFQFLLIQNPGFCEI